MKIPPQSQVLPATGERYLPTQMLGDIELEHLHRYAIAIGFAHDKVVLDIASGEGYGANLLAGVANYVIGVDISQDAVAFAESKYSRANLGFLVGSCDAIPIEDHSIDLAVSFETLEHHDKHEEMLAELKRVLKKDGVLIISTPDKHVYSDCAGLKNHFHIKELYFDEFFKLLADHFKYQEMFGQRIYHGSVVSPLDGRTDRFETYLGDADHVSATLGMANAVYHIAIASDIQQPPIALSILDGTKYFLQSFKEALFSVSETNNELKHLNNELKHLEAELVRMKKTFSWQITKPLRAAWNLPRSLLARLSGRAG